MTKSPIKNVSDTAFMVAAYRALESRRPDAIFHDPLAEMLAGEKGKKMIQDLPRGAFLGGWTVVIRTHLIDNLIQAAITDGVDTVLNLGAGLDTRPYRMELPASLHWIEVDYPLVMDLKDSKLSNERPRCHLERFKLDLADVPARQNFLAQVSQSAKKTLVLMEGVIPYLSEDAVASVGADLRAQDSIKFWIADYFSPAAYKYRKRSGMNQAMKNAPFLFEPVDYFDFFSKAGWEPKEVRYLAEEARNLRRPPPFPLSVKLITRFSALFASPERRRDMGRYAGFVLFKPGPPLPSTN